MTCITPCRSCGSYVTRHGLCDSCQIKALRKALDEAHEKYDINTKRALVAEMEVDRLKTVLQLIKEIYECHPDAKTLEMPHIAHLLYAQADDALSKKEVHASEREG